MHNKTGALDRVVEKAGALYVEVYKVNFLLDLTLHLHALFLLHLTLHRKVGALCNLVWVYSLGHEDSGHEDGEGGPGSIALETTGPIQRYRTDAAFSRGALGSVASRTTGLI